MQVEHKKRHGEGEDAVAECGEALEAAALNEVVESRHRFTTFIHPGSIPGLMWSPTLSAIRLRKGWGTGRCTQRNRSSTTAVIVVTLSAIRLRKGRDTGC